MLLPRNEKLLYGLLFRASAETLLAFGRRHFKGQLGITSVLHTWGQRLALHPHVHGLVTGGALAEGSTEEGAADEGPRWVMAPKGFLFPVRALARVFRGKFCAGLKRAFTRGALVLEGRAGLVEEPRPSSPCCDSSRARPGWSMRSVPWQRPPRRWWATWPGTRTAWPFRSGAW